MTRLLIVGATGLVGHLVLERALADERVDQVVALTRRPVAARARLRNVVLDFDRLPDDAEWWQVDGVVSALGTTRAETSSAALYRRIDHDYPIAVARRAREGGATRLALVSSLGADPHSRFAYTRLKGEVERDAATIGYPSLTIVRPSFLDGNRVEERRGERAMAAAFRMLSPMVPSRWRTSPAADVAATMLEGAVSAEPGVHILHNAELVRG